MEKSCSNCNSSYFIGEGVCGNVCRRRGRVMVRPTRANVCSFYVFDEEDRTIQCAWPLLSKKLVTYD